MNAVECAVVVQRKMTEYNATIEPERRMQFRIGINLGDLISDGDRIFGDGMQTLQRGWRASQNRAAYACPRMRIAKTQARSMCRSMMLAYRRSRISRNRCEFIWVRLGQTAEETGPDGKFLALVSPASDPKRSPYRGLRPLEAEDAGIFFGRDAPIVEALDRLRGLRDAPRRRGCS